MEPYELIQRQSLPLEAKINYSLAKARQFVELCGADPVCQVSGLDSAVMLHLVRKVYPTMPAIFVDTGLEDPTVVDHANRTENMTTIRPDVAFPEVLKKHGYPALSKDVARALSDLQNPTPRNEATRRLRLTGIKQDGTKGKSGSYLPAKYHCLIDCGHRFSDKCCYFLKEKPAKKMHKEMGLAPFVGTLAVDSDKRTRSVLKTGCNNFGNTVVSKPLSIWTRQDIYLYALLEGVSYPKCYGDIVTLPSGELTMSGELHTGCQFCLFGIQFNPDRIERLKDVHPARYRYCMETLNYKEIIPLLLRAARGGRV